MSIRVARVCGFAVFLILTTGAAAGLLAAEGRIAAATYPAFCGQCHGDATSPAPVGLAYPNRAGSHARHARLEEYDCALCHNTPEGPGGTGHFDFIAPADVIPATGSPLVGAGARYDFQSRSCSGFYCHEPAGAAQAQPPVWGQPGSVFCGSCHPAHARAAGDFDGNGRLEEGDLLHFARQWGMTAALPPLDADLDHDGAVDAGDLLLLLADWHATVHAGELGGSHAVHFDAVRGPGITGCTVCHVDNLTTHAPRDGIVHFADGKTLAETGVCNGCHGTTAQTKPIWGECVACADCHNGTHPGHGNPDGSGLAAPDKSGYFFTAGHGLASDSRYAHSGNAGAGLGSCLPCHDARPTTGRHISGVAGDYKRLRSVPSDDLAYTAPIAELCLSCHRPGQTVPGPLGRDATAEALPHSAGVSGHYGTISSAESAFPAYGDESDFALHPGFGCEVCHDAHGTANLGMIRAVVDGFLGGMSAPSSVTLTSASPGWVQTDGTGICEACHRAGGPAHPDTHHPGNHNLGSDCRLCHDNHTGSFQASVSETSCLGCHGTAQGSRRAAGADFMLRSHHVVGGATDGDCRVCHDVSQHAGGTVRLIDYNQTGSVVEFTSDAALEPFCLGCHDADGAGGDTTPFSDGVPVQNVTTGWDAGAHKAAGVSCMGDGTTGCHGNGHGSRKKHLLAQPYTPPTAPGYVEEEEGFCYRCHGEVQGQFALASRHDVAYGDQAVEGGKVECVHCHNPHLATHQHPLVNPDSRANAWTGGETGFCLVCHDGAPPTGVAFPAQSPGSGYNKSRFVGTKHDGAGRTCGHCHAPHGSAQASLKSLRYDQLDSVVWSFGSAQYALCWQCHDEAKTVRSGSGANANNAFGTRHDKHVRGERASCIICHDVHAGYDAGEDGLISFAYPVKKAWNFSLGAQTLSTAFRDTGTNRGSCYFSNCHGEAHNPENYTGVEAGTLK